MTGKIIVTMVFEVDPDLFKKSNPLTTETPWGIPYAISLGDVLEEADQLREKLKPVRSRVDREGGWNAERGITDPVGGSRNG